MFYGDLGQKGRKSLLETLLIHWFYWLFEFVCGSLVVFGQKTMVNNHVNKPWLINHGLLTMVSNQASTFGLWASPGLRLMIAVGK